MLTGLSVIALLIFTYICVRDWDQYEDPKPPPIPPSVPPDDKLLKALAEYNKKNGWNNAERTLQLFDDGSGWLTFRDNSAGASALGKAFAAGALWEFCG